MQTCSVALGLTAITNELFGAKHEKFGPEIGHINTAHYILFVSQQ